MSNNQWVVVTSIEGHPAQEIIACAKSVYHQEWMRRIAEDLTDVLACMGTHISESKMSYTLASSTKDLIFEKMPATKEKREAVLGSWEAISELSCEPERISRPHSNKKLAEFSYIVQPVQSTRSEAQRPLSRTDVEQDLDQLEWYLEHSFSYLGYKKFNYHQALDEIRSASATKGTTTGILSIQLEKVISRLGDGHAGADADFPTGYLPGLVETTASGYAFFKEDRTSFVDPHYPLLKKIDGIELNTWLTKARETVTDGSPALVQQRSIRMLRYLNYLRAEMSIPIRSSVTLELETEDHKDRKTIVMNIASKRPIYGIWPTNDPIVKVPKNIAYLRIGELEGDSINGSLASWLADALHAKGLIIDLRGNSGGTRDLLMDIMPKIMPIDSPPLVVNVAAKKRPYQAVNCTLDSAYLATRFLFPEKHFAADPNTEKSLTAFKKNFQPSWIPDLKNFSDWNYLMIRPDAKSKISGKKTIVLMDSVNFSAADIFLSAIKKLPNVTLMGRPSGGGSSRKVEYILKNSRIKIALGSMISYQSDGQLFDGVGVQPDILTEVEPRFYIGKSDAVLERAIKTF